MVRSDGTAAAENRLALRDAGKRSRLNPSKGWRRMGSYLGQLAPEPVLGAVCQRLLAERLPVGTQLALIASLCIDKEVQSGSSQLDDTSVNGTQTDQLTDLDLAGDCLESRPALCVGAGDEHQGRRASLARGRRLRLQVPLQSRLHETVEIAAREHLQTNDSGRQGHK